MKLDARQAALTVTLALSGGILSGCATAAPASDHAAAADPRALQAFPATLPGYRRHVIVLPPEEREDERRLELIGGKEMTVDCNARGLDGRFEQRDVPGWGYSYWVLESRGQVRSTMMACPPGSERPGFVQAPPDMVRYNSKLPVVVFVPDGMTLRYRIWRAGAAEQAPLR